ncbi:coatomer subunit zeta-1-like isoform X2 [Iris pallida]|uniref:Coatomer subunit zeta n=1 Tax=Iris pallida TaxID=29817 RepID=A0AAX6EG85_IRIPA|nr:coatomer subunit zeta-1-like isoform X2 [Iris pallida]
MQCEGLGSFWTTVLQGFFDAVGLLLRNNVDKRTALKNLDIILLCLDEIVDGGDNFGNRRKCYCYKSCY